jgi:pyruvate formate lyase activating enzyme
MQETASPKQVALAAVEEQCKSVAFTYNEPTIFAEFAIDSALECHRYGVKTVAVTNGYISEPGRRDFFSVMDAANVDLKAFSDGFYRKLCLGTLQPVLDTLVYLAKETSVWLEVTTLLIPGENDSTEELEAMTQWYARELGRDVPLHFSAFHAAYKMNGVERTPASSLIRAREIALRAGIRHVYTGNVHHPQSQATYCGECGEMLIARDGYRLGRYLIDSAGRCEKCKAVVPGVFVDQVKL